MNTNNVLISGGAGYIGSHAVLKFLESGYNVTVLDDLSTGHQWAVSKEAGFIKGSIEDESLVSSLVRAKNIDSVVHFAGSIIVDESVRDPLKYYRNNTANSRTFIESCLNCGVKNFLFSSTASVYGTPASNPVSEDAALSPLTPYGASKLMTEQMLRDVARVSDFRFLALRYFNVAGADPQGRTGQSTQNATHLIKVACQAAVGLRDHIDVYGLDYDTPDGTCIRDYIHVDDLADAHVKGLAYLAGGGTRQVMNCGYGHGYSVLEVLRTVESVAGEKLRIEHALRRPGDPVSLIANSDLLKRELAWTPRFDDLSCIVRTSLDWEKNLLERECGV